MVEEVQSGGGVMVGGTEVAAEVGRNLFDRASASMLRMFRNLVGYMGSGRVSWDGRTVGTCASKTSMGLEDG
jgi:hypothetical protein